MTRVDADLLPPDAPSPAGGDHRHRRVERLLPLLGGVLLGITAMPSGAQGAPAASDGLPRLKLAQVLASLGTDGRKPVGVPPADKDTDPEPRLRLSAISAERASRLATAQASGSGQTPAVPPPAPTAPAPLPEPTRPTPTPARRDSQPALVAQTTPPATPPAQTDSRAATPPPGATGDGVAAQVIGSDDEFLPADELDSDLLPAQRAPDPLTPAQQAEKSAAPGRRWGVAPIRWGGEVSVGLRRSTSEGSGASTSQVYEGRLRANSYLWKPYIALVSGDFALTSLRSQDSGSDAASNNLVGTSISGTGGLSVFPQSRFPFQATLSLSDSRSDGSFSDSNISRRRFAMRQQYRPAVGSWFASGSYDRSELEGDFGSDIVDRISGNYNNQFGQHSLSINGDLSNNRSSDGSTTSLFASASHGFRYSEALSLNTVANIVDQRVSFESADTSIDTRVGSIQLFSFANWSPAESKWRGSGNLRYFQTYSDSSLGSNASQRNLAGSASLSYQASRNLNLAGTLSAITNLEGTHTTSQSLSASYSGDPISLGAFSYNWFASASGSNASSSSGESLRTIGGSLGHSLSRYWLLGEGTGVSANLNQSVGSNRSTGLGSVSSTTLSHSASVSLNASAGDALNGFLSASVSDSRSMGDETSSFQMLNVQLSGNWRINALSELNSNLTWQLSRQNASDGQAIIITDEFGRSIIVDESSKSRNSSLSGTLGYGHRRFLGVRGLRYRLDFRANANDTANSRRFGDPDASRAEDQLTLDLDQRLLFSIGRMETELQYRIGEIQGERHSLIFLRATRSFGAF